MGNIRAWATCMMQDHPYERIAEIGEDRDILSGNWLNWGL